MPANVAPIFPLIANCPIVEIAAANTARDGSGALVTLFSAGANGSRLDFIKFTSAQATPAASSLRIVRIFVTDEAGINPRLIEEAALTAITASNTALGATTTVTFTGGLILKSGQIVKVSQSIYASAADTTHVIARGGNY